MGKDGHYLPALLFAMLGAISATQVAGQDCLEPADLAPWLGTYCPGLSTYSFAANGDIAYLGVVGAVRVLDVSDPVHPVELGDVPVPPGGVNHVYPIGDRLYVSTTAPAGIAIFGRPDDGLPEYLGWVEIARGVGDVTALGTALYVTESGVGIHVFDLTDPLRPSQSELLSSVATVYLFGPFGGYLYVGRMTPQSLDVYDLRDPLHPQMSASVAGVCPLRFRRDGDVGYGVSWYGRVASYDLGDLARPLLLGSLAFSVPGQPQELLHQGNRLLVYIDGVMSVIDVENPERMSQIGYVTHLPSGSYLRTIKDTCYFSGPNDCWYIRSADALFSPLVACHPLEQYTYRMVRQNDLLYLSSHALTIMDVADPDEPVTLSSLVLPSAGGRVALKDNIAYVCAGNAGFHVVDVGDPRAPRLAGTLQPANVGSYDNVVVGRHFLAAVGMNNVLVVYDITNPGAPLLRYSSGGNGSGSSIVARDDYIYTQSTGAPWIYRVSSSGWPTAVGRIENVPVDCIGVFDDLLLTGGWDSLAFVDVSQPDRPSVLGVHSLPSGLPDFDGTYLYVRDHDDDFHVVDLRDVTAPRDLGILQIPYGAMSINAWRGRLLALHGTELVTSLGICTSEPTAVDDDRVQASDRFADRRMTLTVQPNPSNPRTSLAFTLASAGRVTIAAYDLAGRRLATIASDDFESGAHVVTWDGQDDCDRPLAAGVYVVSVTANGFAASARVTIVR